MVANFLDSMRARGVCAAYVAQSRQQLDVLLTLSAPELTDMLHRQVRGGRWSTATAATYLRTLKRYHRFCTAHGRATAFDPTPICASWPLRKRKRRALSDGDWSRLVAAAEDDASNRCSLAGPRRRTLYDFCAWTGLRAKSLRGLTADSFRNHRATQWVHYGPIKTSNGGTVPLSDWIWQRIRRDFIIPARANGTARVFTFLPAAPSRMIRRDLARAGLPMVAEGRHYDFHALRVQCAVNMRRRGVDWRVIQAWLGHREPRTTLAYLDALVEDELLAAAGMRGDYSKSYS